MHCPVCTPISLRRVSLEANLFGHQCPQCSGIFISSTDYWTWLDQHGTNLPEQPDGDLITLTQEPTRAKQCPFCRHLLLPYKIAMTIPFSLDHCNACNGVWFDRDEWNCLQHRNLHDDIHRMFSEPWQRRLRDARHRATMQAIYQEKFGQEDYAEVRRVKAWLDAHPQQSALRAYLNAEDPYRRS